MALNTQTRRRPNHGRGLGGTAPKVEAVDSPRIRPPNISRTIIVIGCEPMHELTIRKGLRNELGVSSAIACKILDSRDREKDIGVQYVHCVMHKCIMVKAGGNENHRKLCTKHGNFTKSRQSRGKETFFRNRGNGLKKRK